MLGAITVALLMVEINSSAHGSVCPRSATLHRERDGDVYGEIHWDVSLWIPIDAGANLVTSARHPGR